MPDDKMAFVSEEIVAIRYIFKLERIIMYAKTILISNVDENSWKK